MNFVVVRMGRRPETPLAGKSNVSAADRASAVLPKNGVASFDGQDECFPRFCRLFLLDFPPNSYVLCVIMRFPFRPNGPVSGSLACFWTTFLEANLILEDWNGHSPMLVLAGRYDHRKARRKQARLFLAFPQHCQMHTLWALLFLQQVWRAEGDFRGHKHLALTGKTVKIQEDFALQGKAESGRKPALRRNVPD